VANHRAERLALNEAAFRAANERMKAWDERHGDRPRERYLCECGSIECREGVELSSEQYEAVRANSCHFLAVPNHDIPDIEIVVEEHDGYVVLEKNLEVRHLVERSDPRA